MSTIDESARKSSGRRLVKRARNLHRLPSSHIPARLRMGDDAQDDVTAPDRGGHAPAQYMNQSIFSMIAAAGSRTDFNTRFDESSESEEDGPVHEIQAKKIRSPTLTVREQPTSPTPESKTDKRKKRLSGHKLMQSLPRLSLKTQKEKHKSRSPSSDATSSSSKSHPRDAPVMSRLLTAEAEFQADYEKMHGDDQVYKDNESRGRSDSSPATLLALRLMEIFGFEKPEKVVAEYPCWLLQSVLLQGYLYITRNHICFYAYLPKKSHTIAKTGYLSKRGKSNPKYKRYWFTLKGDVLSYFSNPSEMYFPQGNIDLRYGISASLSSEKDKQKECKDFSVTTDHRTYHFRADSPTSAKEWVQSLQKTIFRSHNDGDSVKISLPVENIIDIEESPVVEFAETVKIRVIESDDSYAIDEVSLWESTIPQPV